MKNIPILLIAILLVNLGCQRESTDNEVLTVFQIPKIINTAADTTKEKKYFVSNQVNSTFPLYKGKYKFNTMIDLNPENRDTSMAKDFIGERFLSEVYDSLDVNGFEIYTDYQTTIYHDRLRRNDNLYTYYPVFFVNSTNRNKLFLAKDSHAYGIQEAIDTSDNEWRPIEGMGHDFCGNGTWGMVVKPKEFIIMLLRKYKGEHKTSLRTRFRIGETIYVSKSYEGYINESQFTFKKESHLKNRLLKTNGKAAQILFLGAEPNEKNWRTK